MPDILKAKFNEIWERYSTFRNQKDKKICSCYSCRDAMWEEIKREILMKEDGE